MNSSVRIADTATPNPRDISAEQIAQLGDSVLAHALGLYRRRLAESDMLYCAFDSSI